MGMSCCKKKLPVGEKKSPWADLTVKGCEDLDEESHCYKNAFYTLLKHYFDSRDYTTIFLMKAKYDKVHSSALT